MSKVINLSSSSENVQNTGENYSNLLKNLIKPFENDFPNDYNLFDIISFGINAWNLGCISQVIPEEEFTRLLAANPIPIREKKILNKMIALKKKKFAEFDLYIADFDLNQEEGDPVVTVTIQEKEYFLTNMMNKVHGFQAAEEDFDEGYINRYAVILKPKQPFYDWINTLDPDDPVEEAEGANIYLVNETVAPFQSWIRKKFDRFFMSELEGWVTDKSQWPQKRSFKMFREWFHVELSTMIYDLEKQPVYKEDF